MNEHELEAFARGLGRREAAALDVERVAARVVERLGAGDRVREPFGWRRALAAAAAVVVLLGGTVLWRGADSPAPGARVAVGPVPLDELDAPVLSEMLDSLTYQGPAADLVARPTLDDLDEGQLQELLAVMEG